MKYRCPACGSTLESTDADERDPRFGGFFCQGGPHVRKEHDARAMEPVTDQLDQPEPE